MNRVAVIDPIAFDKLNLPALHRLAMVQATVEGHAAGPQGASPTVHAEARRVAKRILADRDNLPACEETGALLALCLTVLHFVGE